jgi:hypothetical protein
VGTPTASGPHEPQLPRDGLEPEECEHLVRDDDPDTALCGVDQAGVPWNQDLPVCQACLAVFQAELADLARVEIARRFADKHPEIGDGTHVATFAGPSQSLGDVVVWVEDEGVIVGVGEMWHGHFDADTPVEMVAKCAGFLDDLFDDRFVVWAAHRDGRALGGGTFDRDVGPGSFYRRLSRKADDIQAAMWSGPWVDEGIDEDTAALADLGRAEFARRFADQAPEIGEGTHVATFTSRSLGEVIVEVESCTRLELEAARFGCGHYIDKGTQEEIIAACAAFLDDLFHDNIVVYRADNGRLGAGFIHRDANGLAFLRRLSQRADDLRAATWSGPWEHDGIVAHG